MTPTLEPATFAFSNTIIRFDDNFSAPLNVYVALVLLRLRGCTFTPLPTGFRVEPFAMLALSELAFLRAHRDAARLVLARQEGWADHALAAPVLNSTHPHSLYLVARPDADELPQTPSEGDKTP